MQLATLYKKSLFSYLNHVIDSIVLKQLFSSWPVFVYA